MQALLGERLIRRSVGSPLELIRERQILLFLLLGGPVSCLVSATWSVGTLTSFGMIRPDQWPFSWWTWWIGDSPDVAVLTPLLLMAFGEPREVWARRRVSVGIPLATMAALVPVSFLLARREFRTRAAHLVQSLQVHVTEAKVILESLGSFHASSRYVDREEFRTFAEGSLRRRPGLHVLSWNPRIADEARGAFESGGIPDAGFPILEIDFSGAFVPALRRPEYVPGPVHRTDGLEHAGPWFMTRLPTRAAGKP